LKIVCLSKFRPTNFISKIYAQKMDNGKCQVNGHFDVWFLEYSKIRQKSQIQKSHFELQIFIFGSKIVLKLLKMAKVKNFKTF